MTGKFFEYIPTQRPILGFGSALGDASKLLQEMGREPILDYNDEQGAYAFIEKYFYLWSKTHSMFAYDSNKYQMLSRKELTSSLSRVLNSITS